MNTTWERKFESLFLLIIVQISDVTIIRIKIKIAIFRKIERNQYRDFLEHVWLNSDTASP